jgi:hypothetical protein
MEEDFRVCSCCKEEMVEGYVVENGEAYYCSDECLGEVYSPEEIEEMFTQINEYDEWLYSPNYWTTWH